jgi:4-amino-4-deoxy-L-arabinose transferase-like glycosyltransferase
VKTSVNDGSRFEGDQGSSDPRDLAWYWAIGFLVFCVWILCSNLGGAALFEPDEGRNAEIAREVLLLKDWVTPHYDFIPRLDKPIFFFDLVALSYKVFGISEWSARLPSALAAVACLLITYRFAGWLFGRQAALWSALILLTSLEFFCLARVVIMDMTLTVFITLALCGFYLGQRGAESGKGRIEFLFMYIALGAATLTKGPVGFLLPSVVIIFYLLVTKRLILLRQMELPLGIPVAILTAAPWYLLAELRNPGYLHYFLWEENIARYATDQFNRSGPWYYFIGVLAAGFFPWTAFLPTTIAHLRKRSLEGERLFLILWIVLPLLFFSLSSSKLPHYILPVFPPLAIIVGATIAETLKHPSAKASWLLSIPVLGFGLLSLVATLVLMRPDFISFEFQTYVHDVFPRTPISFVCANIGVVLIALVVIRKRLWRNQLCLYTGTALSFVLMVMLAEPIAAAVSVHRSSRSLAQKASLLIRPEDQLVLYHGYPSSLPFYLKIRRPIGVAWSGNKSAVLGSHYVAFRRPRPAAGYGDVLYSYEEFADLWKSSERRLVAILDSAAVDRFKLLVGMTPRTLLKIGDTFLLENRSAAGNAPAHDELQRFRLARRQKP